MAVAKQDANWTNVDITSLSQGQEAAYLSYKAKYREMKEQRAAFEQLMNEEAELPKGQRMIFGYNFGKLSVAVVEDDRKVAKPKATTQSLSDFLAQAKAHGDHT